MAFLWTVLTVRRLFRNKQNITFNKTLDYQDL